MRLTGLKASVIAVAALGVTPQAYSGPCPWDCGNFDGNVGIVDFLFLLAQWDDIGTSCDFDGGGVGIVDFLKLLANWGDCPGAGGCDGASGACCIANGSPGCDDPTCCDAVCSDDPFCCDVDWDQMCADSALDLCGGCGDCTMPDPVGSPGCSDPVCQALVCAIDPFCCDIAWDSVCAGDAADFCDCGGACKGGFCGGPGAGDCCIANGSPACDDSSCCELVCSIDPFCCDIEWDATCADLAAQVCVICP